MVSMTRWLIQLTVWIGLAVGLLVADYFVAAK